MKRLLVSLSFLLFLISCSLGSGWSETAKQNFRDDCKKNAADFANADQYCNCALEKVMEKYSSPEASQKITELSSDELIDFFADCIQ